MERQQPLAVADRKQRVPELDGIRGLAILLVLIFHYITQEGVKATGAFTVLQRVVAIGWTGVDLFFVLSGFLIGGILMDVRSSDSYFKTFYVRRFFRIVPIYYAWVVLYIAAVAIMGDRITRLSNSGVPPPLGFGVYEYFFFLQNIKGQSFAGIAGAWFGHLWSLAVEEQFYLIAPFLVRFASPKSLTRILVAVIATVPLLRVFLLGVMHVPTSYVSVLMPCRADALAMGMLIAVLYRTEKFSQWLREHPSLLSMAFALLAAGVVGLWLFSPQSSTLGMQTIGYTWMSLFYATLLLLAIVHPKGFVASFTRIGWLRKLGVVSYCVYIIHLAVNVVLHAWLLHSSPRISTPKGAAVTGLASILAYAAARLSWVLWERPLQGVGHRFKYSSTEPSDIPSRRVVPAGS